MGQRKPKGDLENLRSKGPVTQFLDKTKGRGFKMPA